MKYGYCRPHRSVNFARYFIYRYIIFLWMFIGLVASRMYY
jgi:hypothetical protein